MNASTDPVPSEFVEEPIYVTAPIDIALQPEFDGQRDLYAESELQLRHERTERLIRRAQEQV